MIAQSHSWPNWPTIHTTTRAESCIWAGVVAGDRPGPGAALLVRAQLHHKLQGMFGLEEFIINLSINI
jgi:hypothetical protein